MNLAGAAGTGLLLLALAAAASGQVEKNGFSLDGAAVPIDQIVLGGPPRDGIHALSSPKVVAADEASWSDDDVVVGVALDGAARAYPVAVLQWHELVNDTLGGRSILVSYCPLCGVALVFDRDQGGVVREFGVSGLLYRSDLLLYDRSSESLWSQIDARALAGPATGTRLRVLRSKLTRWGDWKRAHLTTTVLSTDTGHRLPYGESPYGEYALSDRLMFPVSQDDRYHPKMPTLGLRAADGTARGYPAVELAAAGGRVEERFAGHAVAVGYDPSRQVFEVEAPADLVVIEGYWFAWAAFHPDASLFLHDTE